MNREVNKQVEDQINEDRSPRKQINMDQQIDRHINGYGWGDEVKYVISRVTNVFPRSATGR